MCDCGCGLYDNVCVQVSDVQIGMCFYEVFECGVLCFIMWIDYMQFECFFMVIEDGFCCVQLWLGMFGSFWVECCVGDVVGMGSQVLYIIVQMAGLYEILSYVGLFFRVLCGFFVCVIQCQILCVLQRYQNIISVVFM